MSRAQSYQDLARLLAYPQEREELADSLERVAAFLDGRGVDSPAHPFAEFVRGATLGGLQEEYVAAFDFDATRAPYLGHHLYGEPQKRASYLVRLKQEFARFGFTPEGCELPDHLPVLLDFLAHLSGRGEDAFRKGFIAQQVLPGVTKLTSGNASARTHWHPLIETAQLLLELDCKEVSPC